ncbi:Pears and lemons 1 [Hyphodiscus hymeniophilus]|uniref:Pears and lemons 1 n=1 Tax=Hyphodiscus hymeniophilus TaxID=353542 RepID=A0A9P6VMP5_9HELO|nr:Pears and lemons 1 [Hyphodiscus hymeniophilus]
MESSGDKQWASKYLLDPLTASEPSQETGPGSHFYTTPISRAASTSKSPPSKVAPSTHSRSTSGSKGYPTPPGSASPSQSSFHPSNPFSPNHRQTAFGDYPKSTSPQNVDEPVGNGKGRRRGSSLGERFPGDMSHRPLDQLRKESKAANRAPHLKKKHMPGADSIDVLDRTFGGAYHHEGPYDATLLARNTSWESSPIEAVRSTNNEALKATPKENVLDSLRKHVPLQGTAVIPPGMAGLDGRTMQYEEGADLMREPDAPGGAYKRWEHVKYLPEDYKGKGEPSFSIEKALKEHEKNTHRRVLSDGNSAYEMQPRNAGISRQRSASGSNADITPVGKGTAAAVTSEETGESSMQRSHTTGRKVGEGLKKRFGSLRRSKHKGPDV